MLSKHCLAYFNARNATTLTDDEIELIKRCNANLKLIKKSDNKCCELLPALFGYHEGFLPYYPIDPALINTYLPVLLKIGQKLDSRSHELAMALSYVLDGRKKQHHTWWLPSCVTDGIKGITSRKQYQQLLAQRYVAQEKDGLTFFTTSD